MENLLPFERLIWFPFLKGSPIFASTQPPLECGAAGGGGVTHLASLQLCPWGRVPHVPLTLLPRACGRRVHPFCVGLDQLGKHTWSTIGFSHLPRSETRFPHL